MCALSIDFYYHYYNLAFYIFLEILPLIEFYLEDNITDNDALKFIQNSYDEGKLKNESQNKSHNSNMLILDSNEENRDQSVVDPFAYKLMNLEVK